MATIQLPPDFKEFLRLLNSNEVEYLLIGGYAVSAHGYVRTTGDIDIWVAVHVKNAERLVRVLHEFGFGSTGVDRDDFLALDAIIRMGAKPFQIEIFTSIPGVDFDTCFANRKTVEIDGVQVAMISLADLLKNKRASGRPKDIADVAGLEEL